MSNLIVIVVVIYLLYIAYYKYEEKRRLDAIKTRVLQVGTAVLDSLSPNEKKEMFIAIDRCDDQKYGMPANIQGDIATSYVSYGSANLAQRTIVDTDRAVEQAQAKRQMATMQNYGVQPAEEDLS